MDVILRNYIHVQIREEKIRTANLDQKSCCLDSKYPASNFNSSVTKQHIP